jgi:prefoldin subunit 5
MGEMNASERTNRLYSRIAALESDNAKLTAELAEVNAAFTSLSQLVYENQPHLLKRLEQRRELSRELDSLT